MKTRERKAFTKEERKLMIVQALLVEMERDWNACMTVADFAHALRVTPSTKLRIMCNELVVEGVLMATEQRYPGITGKRVFYSIPDGQRVNALRIAKRHAKQAPRSIKINGQQIALDGF